MPTFNAQAERPGLVNSIRRVLTGGALSPLDEMRADSMAADTAHKSLLVDEMRYKLSAMRRADQAAEEARAEMPNRMRSFAANTAGIDRPQADQLYKAITGARERPPIELDDNGNRMPDVTFAAPKDVTPGQSRLYRNALAAVEGGMLGGGKWNPDQLGKAIEHIHERSLIGDVQSRIARDDVQGASAVSQGSKPGTAIRLFDNIGSTGATFAPATGAVQADPKQQPENELLRSTVDENVARAVQSRAAAGASSAHADLFRAQTTNENNKPTNPAAFKDVTTLRKEFNDQPEVKAFRDVLPIIESARTTPDTRPGDIQLAYAVGKILDPNSVVREGELKLVGSAATIDQKLQGELRTLVMGKGRLTPKTRGELIAMLDNAAGQREAAYQATERTYRGIAQQNGFPVDQVIITPAPRKPSPTQQPASLPTTNARGWRLMRDARGNQAYVSPDGSQFEEAK